MVAEMDENKNEGEASKCPIHARLDELEAEKGNAERGLGQLRQNLAAVQSQIRQQEFTLCNLSARIHELKRMRGDFKDDQES